MPNELLYLHARIEVRASSRQATFSDFQKSFDQLFRFFHLADNSNQIPFGQPGHDKLYKVRRLLDLVSPHFEEEYTIHQECTIDEAMIPFKGRIGFKQVLHEGQTYKVGDKSFCFSGCT